MLTSSQQEAVKYFLHGTEHIPGLLRGTGPKSNLHNTKNKERECPIIKEVVAVGCFIVITGLLLKTDICINLHHVYTKKTIQ